MLCVSGILQIYPVMKDVALVEDTLPFIAFTQIDQRHVHDIRGQQR